MDLADEWARAAAPQGVFRPAARNFSDGLYERGLRASDPRSSSPGMLRFLACLATFAFFVGRILAADPSPPNIVFILADDLGYSELSSYGQTRYATPRLDRLAQEGIRFTDHYAGSTICAPSRAALMTGRDTGHTRVRGNFGIVDGRPGQRVPLGAEEITIAEVLKRAGYRTGLIGKWGLGEEGSGSEPWHRGFDFFYGFLNQAHAHNQYPEFLYRGAEKEPLVPNFSHEEGTFANDRFTEEALAFLDRERTGPFFLYLAYTTPHADLRCPPDAREETAAAFPELAAPGVPAEALTFAAMVRRLDRDVGRLIDRLRQLGLAENTLVLFTSDNGPHVEDGKPHEFFHPPGSLRGSKRDLYEGGIRVPLIAWWPGRIAAGRESAHPSALWDFPATAAELAGAQAYLAPGQGVSYVKELLGQPGQQTPPHLYWETVVGQEARQALRVGRWKLVRNGLGAAPELYDLVKDHSESNNLAPSEPERVQTLLAQLEAARTESTEYPLRLPSGISSSGN
jgi:arylsulfatase A